MAGISEAAFQQQVEDVATRYGWLIYHTHDSRRSRAGFPDLVMVKGSRVVYAELKKAGNYPTAEQRTWLKALHLAGQEVTVWWPKDLPSIIQTLGPRAQRAVLLDRYAA